MRYYGQWMRDEAERRIGHLYPKIAITADMVEDPENPRPDLAKYVGGKPLTVIAWLWARTVKSPNPAFAAVDVPLASTFMLSTKTGKEAYVEPVIREGRSEEREERSEHGADSFVTPHYSFLVKVGKPRDAERAKRGTKLSRGANFECLMSGTPIASDHIHSEAKAGRMGSRLMAIVAEGDRGRVYLAPTPEHEVTAHRAQPEWKPDVAMPENPRWFSPPLYGLKTYGDLFTPRQLVALTTFSDLVQEARERVRRDAIPAGLPDDGKVLEQGGAGATAYADAVGVYLGLAVDKATDYNTTLVAWSPTRDQAKSTFARQALPMLWDYAEINPLARAAGDFSVSLEGGVRFLEGAAFSTPGLAAQIDAATETLSVDKAISTDPPYYDNIGYADLSDFFYVWLRRSMRPVFPELFATLAVPKTEELVATPYRHGSKASAETFFLDGMTQAMQRSIGIGTNALASSIVLVCRKRHPDAPTATRREFITALKSELPAALAHLQRGNIAPVDLAQAAIGPGMAVYTRYAEVLDAEGKPLPVRAVLGLINQTLDEALAEQEGDFDADTRWALTWFDQMAFNEGEYGVAEQLSKSKNTSVTGLEQAGILVSKAGKVRLLRPAELPVDWDPTTDQRLTVWEMVHQLIRVLESGGETAAAALLAKLGSESETARELCYRLYTLCERKKRANEAMAYNGLVQSWPEIARLARETGSTATQGTGDLFDADRA